RPSSTVRPRRPHHGPGGFRSQHRRAYSPGRTATSTTSGKNIADRGAGLSSGRAARVDPSARPPRLGPDRARPPSPGPLPRRAPPTRAAGAAPAPPAPPGARGPGPPPARLRPARVGGPPGREYPRRLEEGPAMSLTPEQRQAVARAAPLPTRVTDPDTNTD